MDRSNFDLSGRIAVITGGGTGIGKAIASGLAQAGATVVLCGRRHHKCEAACSKIGSRTGSQAYAGKCDVTDKNQIESFVSDTVKRFGNIHILVNNAGVASNYHVLDLPEEEWDRVLDTNLKGCFLFSQAVGKIMAAGNGGTIINIGSQLGKVTRANRVHYSTSKGGIKILTKALAVDLAPHGIRVNSVAPGPVDTEMARPALSDPDLKSKILDHIPLGRIGQTEDISGAVVFLASDAASYITGVTLYVDGGYLTV